MLDQDLLIKSATEATAEVFSMMLGMEAQFTGLVAPACPLGLGIISIVGITGEWGGSGVFCCSPALASIAWARMLGEEQPPGSVAVNDEVLDVVAEITNMMIGNVKNGLETVTGPLAISVPTVIHGKNFEFRNAAGPSAVAMSFATEGETFEVRISLAPVGKQDAPHSRVPVLGIAHP